MVWSLECRLRDVMAMVVSDAGLASTEPEWWNCSPTGCLLIALQPRGGWQIMQRAVQWGNDSWAPSFGVNCKMPVLYCYFACSMRNRLEAWDSVDFICPQEGVLAVEVSRVVSGEAKMADVKRDGDGICKSTSRTSQGQELKKLSVKIVNIKGTEKAVPKGEKETTTPGGWKIFLYKTGPFTIQQPTKLTDDSRGGQAFICSLLIPEDGNAYSIDQQAHMQFLSIVFVIASVAKSNDPVTLLRVLREDFDLTEKLGSVFKRMRIGLMVAELAVLGFVTSVFYALWGSNMYGKGAPYVLQLCSLSSWAFGASGLLMMGGNPQVEIQQSKTITKHIQERIDTLKGHYVELSFGSLHGSIFTLDRGSAFISKGLVREIFAMKLELKRDWKWRTMIVWFALHILVSVTIQAAGSKVATIQSQIMGITILVTTSIVRGQGVSGPEEWMIPR